MSAGDFIITNLLALPRPTLRQSCREHKKAPRCRSFIFGTAHESVRPSLLGGGECIGGQTADRTCPPPRAARPHAPPVRPPPAAGPFLQPARLRAPQTSLAAPPRVLGFEQPKSMRWCMAARMAATMPDGQASWGWLDERLLAPIGGHGAASCPSPPCVKGGRLGAVSLRGSPANNNGRETIPVAIPTATPVQRRPQPPAPAPVARAALCGAATARARPCGAARPRCTLRAASFSTRSQCLAGENDNVIADLAARLGRPQRATLSAVYRARRPPIWPPQRRARTHGRVARVRGRAENRHSR